MKTHRWLLPLWVRLSDLLGGRLQRCAACGEVFDLDDHAEEDDDE